MAQYPLIVVVVLVAQLLASPVLRAAEPPPDVARIDHLIRQAMQDYDALEFETAKNRLFTALDLAQTSAAYVQERQRIHLSLGIVFGAGLNDRERAIDSFLAALRINEKAVIDPDRATPVLVQLFNDAKAQLTKSQSGVSRSAIVHQSIDTAPAEQSLRITAQPRLDGLARDIASGVRMVLYYHPEKTAFYISLQMDAVDDYFAADIPSQAMQTDRLYYYIELLDAGGKRLAQNGNAASPHIVVVARNAAADNDDSDVDGHVIRSPQSANKFGVSALFGTGVGIVVGGESEHVHPRPGTSVPKAVEVEPGGALTPFHLAAELTYAFGDRWQAALWGRFQVLNGLTGASVTTPGAVSAFGLVRFKRRLGDGEIFRPYLSLGLGGGQMRHRIPLGDYDQNGSTDNEIVDARVSGIAGLSAGSGAVWMFSRHVGWMLDLQVIFLVPQFAAHVDLSSGLTFAF